MGSITGALLVTSFIGGLFCQRVRTALIVGGAVALIYAALVVIGLWRLLADANLPYLLGALVAFCLTIALPAVLACTLRRLAGLWLDRGGASAV
jgi:hypothetical protein